MDEIETMKKKIAAYKTAIKKINDCVDGDREESESGHWFDGVHDALTELEEDLEVIGDQHDDQDEDVPMFV